jgi:ubiquinone/menaquinone biosynthesis C-methylase UbiE
VKNYTHMTNEVLPYHWSEETSRRYIDFGHYFVPAREQQMRIMVELLEDLSKPRIILELCCGEGLLADMLLEQIPGSHVLGMDGSKIMLERASKRLARFGDRIKLSWFELADHSWRTVEKPVQAVISSLAIHHLDGQGKQDLFKDIYRMLSPRGAVIIADMTEPTTVNGRQVAANAWDDMVRKRSHELDGSTAALDFFLKEGWNTYRYSDPDDIDHPSPLFDQLRWLKQAGFVNIDVHFYQAGHAVFSGWKKG